MMQQLVVNTLNETQVEQLHSIYQSEWWSVGRSIEDVRAVLRHSDFIFGIVSSDSKQLLAFARVLTDRVFKALLLDVIVHPKHRGSGLGSFLVTHILTDPILSRVRHIELYCKSERLAFYQRHGFSGSLGDFHFMRRNNESQ